VRAVLIVNPNATSTTAATRDLLAHALESRVKLTIAHTDSRGHAVDIARDAGLGVTIHAGELAGAESVRDAIDLVRPARIGHGVRAIEDMDLVRRIADLGIVLEVCPGSNIALKVFPDFESHPLKTFFDMGVKVTLNSDDPPFFDTSLAKEYEIAKSRMGFSDADLNHMTRTALEAAFVDEPTRARLLAMI